MSFLPRLAAVSLFWKIYFCSLYLAFVLLAFALAWKMVTAGTGDGFGVVAGFLYLFLLLIYIAVSALVYKFGEKHQYVRPVFATLIILSLVSTIAFFLYTAYKQERYDTYYRPLTRTETLQLIQSCEITSIDTGSSSNNLIRLEFRDGHTRTTQSYSNEDYEDELQRALKIASC